MERNEYFYLKILFRAVLLAVAHQSSPASACDAASFPVVIDIGHSPSQPGAISATGRPEFEFNRDLATTIEKQLLVGGYPVTVLQSESGGLISRAARANAIHPRLFLSIHHDSVQPQYLQFWTANGRIERYSDRFQGWSLFVSRDNVQFDRSLSFATALANALRTRGLPFSRHHAEPISHENKTLLDPDRGIYAYDGLVILRRVRAPAALIEAGVIVNRDEERRAATPERRALIAESVAQAVLQFCDFPP
ncbi:N-acetylmuramoyl-L-alanine amidase [uncultured Rhodoblastus sp.]|uniref:N-acetylmuramoyl-L-alanine amidase family protein n=1 Tax=uncultured Rhodoblastus sp. TaxID=543037 RepID=UPI0025EBCBCC|nr:N-acetylmuramoyl-L-alanine amidase [uncultured Rhodoblastus sp.]